MSLSTLPILPPGWTPSSLTLTELTMGCCCCTTLCEANDPSSLIFEQQHPWRCLIHGKCATAIQTNRVRWIWGSYSQIQSRTRKVREVTFSHKVAYVHTHTTKFKFSHLYPLLPHYAFVMHIASSLGWPSFAATLGHVNLINPSLSLHFLASYQGPKEAFQPELASPLPASVTSGIRTMPSRIQINLQLCNRKRNDQFY